MSDGRLAGRVAIVTGGAGGIGGATAHRLSAEGARVVVVDLDGERAAEVAASLPGDALAVAADVALEEDVDRYAAAAVERFGRIDLHQPPQRRDPGDAPNSYGGPAADPAKGVEIGWDVDAAELARTVYERHAEDDDFSQPGTLVREVMDDAARETLVANIVEHASDDVSSDMQLRVIAYWTRVDEQIGARVAAGLGHGNGSSPNGELREAQALIDARAGTA
jgi:hypothetical protein